jgi:hypothetical protein
MNDLVELKEGWGQPDPLSSAAYSSARAALLQQIAAAGAMESAPKRSRRHGGRPAWLIGGTAVTAALAAAVAFAVLPGGTPAGHSTGQVTGSQSYDQLTAQQILLAAAEVAQNKPATTGKYWHTKIQFVISGRPGTGTTSTTEETWVTGTGEGYGFMPEAGGVELVSPHGALTEGNAFTLADIEKLPTDPAALIAWVKNSIAHPATPPKYPLGPGEMVMPQPPAWARPGLLPGMLVHLLYRVPAPPAVRAAAFRALASLPNVTKLGSRDGGQALRIRAAGEGQMTVVIDPATATLISDTFDNGSYKILAAEWTNTMPKIVTPAKK